MRKTNSTLVPNGGSSRKANGKHKTALTFALFFLFALVANSLNAQCSISCKNVNISVGQSCEADLNWSTLAHLPSSCNATPEDEDFTIKIFDQSGLLLGSSDSGNIEVDLHAYIDDSVTIEVYYTGAGGNNNYCWSTALVEDKMPPQVECVNDTVTCLAGIIDYFPPVTDNCADASEIDMIVRSKSYIPICDDDFIKIMIREFQAEDPSGNLSAMCTDTIWFERFDLGDVDVPPNYTEDSVLLCNGDWDANENGYPDFEETGVPEFEGMPLYPDQIDPCNLQFTFQDREFEIPCGTKIMRTWTGMEWCNGSDRLEEFVQVINILDTVPPEVEVANDYIQVSTSHFSCEASVIIPPATVTDNCSEITSYIVSTNAPGVPLQEFDEPRAVTMPLPIGSWEVYITAYDECYQNNGGSDTITVDVVDATPPVAVCDQNTNVSVTIDGSAKIFAETFDDNSHDECGPIESREVRRMDLDCNGETDDFGPYVEFCCEDIEDNPIQIILRVTDQSGNTNECMVNVEVQDKLPASIEAPDDITVSCEFPFEEDSLDIFGTVKMVDDINDIFDPNLDPRDSIILNDPGDDTNGPVFKGLDGYAHDNCDVTISVDEEVDMGDCGSGTITRTFQAIGAGNDMQAEDVQTITFTDFFPFNASTIDFPDDVVITNTCDTENDLTPEFIDSLYPGEGFPSYSDDACSQVARSYEDHVFPIDDPDDPACFKILRKWKILDWCTYDQGGEQPWENTQVIKVMNNVAPTFDLPCRDTLLLSIDGDCDSRFVTLVQEATDDCTAKDNLQYSWRIDAFSDGTFEYSGNDNDASGDYPVGKHLIQWTVYDQCGNSTTCSYTFEIESRKGPTPVCRNFTVGLMGIDSTGNGEYDFGMVDIAAEQFDIGSYHACPGIEVTAISFSEDPSNDSLTLTCDDIGTKEVEVWVHASNGTSIFCKTYVIVQAQNGACGQGNEGPTFPIAGSISNPIASSALKDVEVDLHGASSKAMTDEQGNYQFAPMPEGGRYTVAPGTQSDVLNGVSTFDILLIQRHILGMDVFDDPYRMIAADVNNDEKISGADIIDLRKVILGLKDQFPNNKSWRFVDQEYQFRTSSPLEENFDEAYDIDNLNQAMTGVNFYGVKIGDVNGSASGVIEGRSGETLKLTMDNRQFEKGETIVLPVTSENFESIFGFQFTLMYNPQSVAIKGIQPGIVDLSSSNMAVHEDPGAIAMSWSNVKALSAEENDVLFTLELEALKNGAVASSLSMSDQITKGEAYSDMGNQKTALTFRSTENFAEFALYQNSPNPFSDKTIIGYEIPESAEVTLTFFDMTGKEVLTLEREAGKGYNQVELNANDFNAKGVIYYTLESGEYSATKKMIVLE